MPDPPTAATIGVFDGVHRGHRKLLHLIRSARGLRPTVVTFSRNPTGYLVGEGYPGDLMTLQQKLEALGEEGMKTAVVIDFTEEFRNLSGESFLTLLSERLFLEYLVIGRNFRCGRDLETAAEEVQRILAGRDVRVDIASAVTDNEGLISSTRIRRAIQDGDLETARRLLGHEYVLDTRQVRVDERNGLCRADRQSLTQVLPRAGTFRGQLQYRNGTYETELTLDRDEIAWTCPGSSFDQEYPQFITMRYDNATTGG